MARTPWPWLILLLSPDPGSARTWYINTEGTGDAPTIAAALDSVSAGDGIELAPGRYMANNLNFITSNVSIWGEVGAPEDVVIDGGGVGQILYIHHANGIALRNLTFTHADYDLGAAVRCKAADLSLADCLFLDNTAGDAAAIWCESSTMMVATCRFQGNTARADAPAIVLFQSSAAFDKCAFVDNYALYCSLYGRGGAIYMNQDCSAVVSRCSFEGNVGCWGGAIYCNTRSSLTITDSSFRRNGFRGFDYSTRRGTVFVEGQSTVSISQSSFFANRVEQAGGAVSIESSTAYIDRCTFFGNQAATGAHLGTYNVSSVVVSRSIFASGSVGSAFVCAGSGSPELSCSDVFANEGGDWVGCVADQVHENGNFSADPLFCNPEAENFTLIVNSPCAPPGLTGCSLIGALPVGCGPVSVDVLSWVSTPAERVPTSPGRKSPFGRAVCPVGDGPGLPARSCSTAAGLRLDS